jgi:hypothetical protein
VIYTFNSNIVSGSASITGGTGSVSGSPAISGNTMTINLTGVTNAQLLKLTLSNVTSSTSQVMPNAEFTVGFLLGDTNGDRVVNGGDAIQTRSRSGQVADGTNFRSDVNTDGNINGGDSIIVRGRSGSSVSSTGTTEE